MIWLLAPADQYCLGIVIANGTVVSFLMVDGIMADPVNSEVIEGNLDLVCTINIGPQMAIIFGSY